MNKLFAYLFGAGVGAGLMYYLDPIQGNRRRAMVRDQVVQMRNDLDDGIETGMRDLQNRARGIVAETSSRFSREQPSDWVLAERARSRLGFLTSHPGAIEVTAQTGALILEGDVLQQDVDRLTSGLSHVRGVSGIDNRLRVHETPNDIPGLQGGGQLMRGQGQWNPSTRLLAGIGSLYLFLRSRNGGILGPFLTLGSLALGLRTIVNRPLSQMIGMTGQRDLIPVNKSINIPAPVDDVFGLWSNFTQFPKFMSHVRDIQDMGNGRYHWVVDGPAGVPAEFDTVVTREIPNELIAWKTVDDSPVKHTGQVHFHPARNGSTQVNVHMEYNPPAGVVGHAIASFFGSDPKSEMDDDLMRLKSLFQTGGEGQLKETFQRRQHMSSR